MSRAPIGLRPIDWRPAPVVQFEDGKLDFARAAFGPLVATVMPQQLADRRAWRWFIADREGNILAEDPPEIFAANRETAEIKAADAMPGAARAYIERERAHLDSLALALDEARAGIERRPAD